MYCLILTKKDLKIFHSYNNFVIKYEQQKNSYNKTYGFNPNCIDYDDFNFNIDIAFRPTTQCNPALRRSRVNDRIRLVMRIFWQLAIKTSKNKNSKGGNL